MSKEDEKERHKKIHITSKSEEKVDLETAYKVQICKEQTEKHHIHRRRSRDEEDEFRNSF